MTDQTPILSLPFIMPAQAQKHVTHNEALRILDVAVQLAVINRTRTAPPATPAITDRYIVAGPATGPWAGQEGRIALYTADGWEFVQPKAGWQAHVIAENKIAFFTGTVWDMPVAGASNPSLFGVNATPDATSRLAVSSPATLLSHEGAGHQVKVNKAGASNTASLLFQTGFSGRAEMGTLGDEAFAVKVSVDGVTFAEAFRAAGGTGHVSLPGGVLAGGFTLRDGGDVTKTANFVLSGITTGTLRSFSLPNLSGEIAVLGGAQTFIGSKTFSGGVTVSGGFDLTGTIGSFGTAVAAASYGVGVGATVSGAVKAVGIGTGGVSGSTTVVTIGSGVAGALGSVVVNAPLVTFGPTVADVTMDAARLTAASLGLGTVASAASRLSVAGTGTQLSHDGAGHQLRINKAGGADSASLQFQSGLTGRAELGLIGTNSFDLRVSGDGISWQSALTAAATGQVSLAQPAILVGQAAEPVSPVNGMIWHNGATGQLRARVGGVSKTIDSQLNIPFLTPVAGEYILTTSGAGGSTLTTLAGAVGRVDLYPFVPGSDVTLNGLSVNVTTAVAAALCKACVYAADSLGRPASLITETADMDCATAGLKTGTVALMLRQGVTYWLGVRHSSMATLSAWALTATPDINGGAPSTAARKVLRRTVTYAGAAPATWGFVSGEINSAAATAIWGRVV